MDEQSQDVALKTCRKSIVKGGGKGSGISVLMARPDYDDENVNKNNKKAKIKSLALQSIFSLL